jgi:hypothetical protein
VTLDRLKPLDEAVSIRTDLPQALGQALHLAIVAHGSVARLRRRQALNRRERLADPAQTRFGPADEDGNRDRHGRRQAPQPEPHECRSVELREPRGQRPARFVFGHCRFSWLRIS